MRFCKWYSKFTISTIESIAINKERCKQKGDITFDVFAKNDEGQPFNFHTHILYIFKYQNGRNL